MWVASFASSAVHAGAALLLSSRGGSRIRARTRCSATSAGPASDNRPGRKVLVVESPKKASSIQSYMGNDFTVLATYGHIRDLVTREESVQPEADFAMTWAVDDAPRSQEVLADIQQALRGAQTLLLATDPDREGEAISWHLLEVLRARRVDLQALDVQRITFTEVTPEAVQEALGRPRELSEELIEAYLARRALDFLVGFKLSPLLWRKVARGASAGRVQSVALRMVCEREREIEEFCAQEYWTIEAHVASERAGATFKADLTHVRGEKLEKFSIPDATTAQEYVALLERSALFFRSLKTKRVRRTPAAPFVTSTMQQAASTKLGLSASATMKLAQDLYEGVRVGGTTKGLITYMRTDGCFIAAAALRDIRAQIERQFGSDFVPSGGPRFYKTRVKNAQEAHEAIRPTSIDLQPAQLPREQLSAQHVALYRLIWERTLASQMADAAIDQFSAVVAGTTTTSTSAGATSAAPEADDAADESVRLRASCSVVVFPGFLAASSPGGSAAEEEEDEAGPEEQAAATARRARTAAELAAVLGALRAGERVVLAAPAPAAVQHETQPPPRYNDASLIRALEEQGIGRPSTYAPTLKLLDGRAYVTREGRALVPSSRGRVVTAFLCSFFPKYFDYAFTADLEAKLDLIASGGARWRHTLREFWQPFRHDVQLVGEKSVTEVIDVLDAHLASSFFPERPGRDLRACPQCGARLTIKASHKYGAFVGCSAYPACTFNITLAEAAARARGEEEITFVAYPKLLGTDEQDHRVWLKRGPYGVYIEREAEPSRDDGDQDAGEDAGTNVPPSEEKSTGAAATKAQRVSLPNVIKGQESDVTLEYALSLLAFPVSLGAHPEDEGDVTLNLGPYGFYVRHADVSATVPKKLNVDEVDLAKAVELLQAKRQRASKRSTATTRAPKKKRAAKTDSAEAAASTEDGTLTKKKAAKKKTRAAAKKKKQAVATGTRKPRASPQPKPVSAAFASFIGVPRSTRPAALKHVWAYAKANNLQDPADGRRVLCDETLRNLLGVDAFASTELMRLLKPHFEQVQEQATEASATVASAESQR